MSAAQAAQAAASTNHKRKANPAAPHNGVKKARSDGTTSAPMAGALHRVVQVEHANLSFREIIKLPPSALKGVSEGRGDELFGAFNLYTIEDVGNWEHFKIARAIVMLADADPPGRPAENTPLRGKKFNMDGALVKEYEGATFKELAESPVSCLNGLAEWVDPLLNDFSISTVRQLANLKFVHWAEALVTLAKQEE